MTLNIYLRILFLGIHPRKIMFTKRLDKECSLKLNLCSLKLKQPKYFSTEELVSKVCLFIIEY